MLEAHSYMVWAPSLDVSQHDDAQLSTGVSAPYKGKGKNEL